ncbi:unnamed protein product [Larinioides sclopetarius]|uniref:Apyrase n=1 Tax=Larinioides sclopetarius TaxID=280406 RepID=A0AAV2ASY0_9ARAC
MHQRKSEYEPLLGEMLTVYIESNLASPLSGNVAIEVNPRSNVRDIINNFLFSLQRDSSVPGLAVFDKHFNKLDWNASIESQGIEEGSKLYIGYDKSRIFRPFHIAVVGAATLVIAIILLIVSCVLFGATGGSVAVDYGIVIDAGSTHTEIFLYYWSGSKDHGTGVVKQKNSCEYEGFTWKSGRMVTLEGIASGFDPENILSCLNNVTKNIPNGLPSPRLYLGATGGMRLLNASDPKDANLILMTFKYALSTKPVQVETVDIIKGEDEALFSWISTNFLNQSLTQGQESGSGKLADPCLPIGFQRSLDAEELSEDPCVDSKNFSLWLRNNPDITRLSITGASNYSQCKKSIELILDEDKCKDMGYVHCLNSPRLGALNSKFMAFSGFYYVVQFFNASRSLEEFTNATKNWCSLNWTEIQQITPKSELHHVSRYCFAGVYIIELLTSKYGFDSSTWKNIDFKNEVGGADVGWTLGFMINATNSIPEKIPSPPAISLGIFVPLLSISIIMAVLSIFVLRNHIKRFYHHGHDRLLHI